MPAQQLYHSATVTNTVELVSDETCIIRWFDAYNGSDACFVQIFDAQDPSDVTLGTTAPTLSFGIPEGGGHDYMEQKTQGIEMKLGLCIAATATATGNGAPGSSPNVNIMLLKSP